MNDLIRTLSLISILALTLVGCGGGASEGDLTVFVEAEESITSGIASGAGDEDIQDGWTVTYTKFIVAIGEVELNRSANDGPESSSEVLVVDMTSLGTEASLVDFEGLDAERWDLFSFRTPVATASATRHSSVSQVDYDEMVASGLTYIVAGNISQMGGESCVYGAPSCRPTDSVDFSFHVAVPTTYSNCESPGSIAGGVVIPSGGTGIASLTLHGDHIFFNAFPGGAEVITRRAQWLADADADGDDLVDITELEGITGPALTALFPSSDYNLSGSPVAPFESADDWVVGQLATQGHLDGEGECLWMLD